MGDDLLDWADVAAIGVLSKVTQQDEPRPVEEAWFWYALHRHEEDVAGHTAVADALRESFEAGAAAQRDFDVAVCHELSSCLDPCHDIANAADCERAVRIGLTPGEAARRIREGESLDA